MTERYVKYVRLSTGDHVAVAHVLDRETGSVVESCGHRHKTKRLPGWDESGVRKTLSGTAQAERCGDKLLARFLASRRPSSERGGE